MYETVTVDEAIRKGHRMVNYPSIAIIIGIAGLSIYTGSNKLLPGWTIFIGFIVAFIAGWLYWSWKITQWRLWAFENVRNVRELKKRAILENLIWNDGSWFEKTEIRNAVEKEKWSLLKEKLNKEYLFEDDLTIPIETVIYYSKGKKLVEVGVLVLLAGGGIYLIVADANLFIGLLMTAIGSYFSYKEYRQSNNKNPQIILNEKGIETTIAGFCDWEDIFKEELVRKSSGKNTSFYLVYNHPKGRVELLIDDLNTDYQTLLHLLMVYRGRYEKKKQRL